ncbi:MAG: hypothetical protein M1838_005224 [Thelocarpon superellum]|nr:MAG: hypothetical protein M1838_005224 [Thelocarpon superellum]
MASNLLSFVGWTFLPNMVTGWVQSIYYGISIRAGEPKPPPGSPRYVKHRRRINILVIAVYLLYTIYEADWQMRRAGDFYSDLGVTPAVEDRVIKSKFRRLAALHHPDKVASTETEGSSDAVFVHLRLAQDTLLHPVKRFAYDRFGPDIVEWQHCLTVRDYLLVGLQGIIPFYAGAGLVMIVLGMLGYLEWGRYWRYVSFVGLLVFEVFALTRPYFPPITSKVVDPALSFFSSHTVYLPFQQIILARKILLTLFIAFSQLGPLLQSPSTSSSVSSNTATPGLPPSSNGPAPRNAEEALQTQITRLGALSKATDTEASRLLGLDMAPFAGDEAALAELRGRLKEWLVQNTIRSDREVRDAVGTVLARRRQHAPHGARGTL